MTESVAIIPARGGSKSIPNKNIVELGGLPLVAHTIIACKNSGLIPVVSTEDANIAKISASYGATILDRPAHLSSDIATDHGFLKHFFDNYQVNEAFFMRPTSPLRDPEVVKSVMDFYYNSSVEFTGLRTVHESRRSPYKMFKIDNDGIASGLFEDFNGIKNYTNLPRQTFPLAYEPNGYCDIVLRETVEAGLVYGDIIYCYQSPFIIDIDEPFDLVLARQEVKDGNA
jgi:CMP-N,N'-diacetyllegionaminic acid synthase